VPAKNLFYFILNSPWGFKIVYSQKDNKIGAGIWIRVVIRFRKEKFRIWVYPEEDVPPTELDEGFKSKEFKKKGAIKLNEPGLKEG